MLAPKGPDSIPAMRSIEVRRVGPLGGHLWEQAVLPSRWRGPLLNLCNTAPAMRGDQVVCIHDANVHRMPDSYGRGFRMLYRTLQPMLARRAARIATVSHDAARQLAQHLPVRVEDVVVLPNGHEHALRWRREAATVFDAEPQRRPFVLLLGSRARHKNAGLVLGLAGALDRMGVDLLVAGSRAAIFAAERAADGPNIRALGPVTDDDLALLFSRALCLAFPSFTEGFGLPIVEAMALGCPVVSSDRASMPEVCGDAALMASPDSGNGAAGRPRGSPGPRPRGATSTCSARPGPGRSRRSAGPDWNWSVSCVSSISSTTRSASTGTCTRPSTSPARRRG